MAIPDLDAATQTALEAAAFRPLVEHLRARIDVQNIGMMNPAGLGRNCLSHGYREAADPAAREIGHGMTFGTWQAKHQTDATPGQPATFAETMKGHG